MREQEDLGWAQCLGVPRTREAQGWVRGREQTSTGMGKVVWVLVKKKEEADRRVRGILSLSLSLAHELTVGESKEEDK